MFFMILFLIFSAQSAQISKVNLYEFNKTQYSLFRDSLEKNHFLISIEINNYSDYLQFYKKFFVDICNSLSYYVNDNINFTYSVLINPDYNKKDAVYLIYLPGLPETEVSVYPRMPIAYNSNKILNKCLTQLIQLLKFEKSQKSLEVTRIKEELHKISKMMKILPPEDPKRKDLLNDYSALTNELMQYTSEKKQEEKKLKLQLQLYPEGSSQAKKIEKKIQKIQRKREKMPNRKIRPNHSPKKLQKIVEKKMINTLKNATHESYLNIFKSAYGNVKTKLKKIWNTESKKQIKDL